MSHNRILIADDQKLMRHGLRVLLELEQDMLVVAEAGNGQEALDQFKALAPDVVLMDINMPVMDGVAATRALIQSQPDARIIILTTFDSDEYILDGIRAGARGYMLKDMSGDELAQAIRTVMAGGSLLDPAVVGRVMAAVASMPSGSAATVKGGKQTTDSTRLNDREHEILRLVAEGLSNPQIGRKLHLAEGTIKNYVSNILQKTNTRDRTQAVVEAQRRGLI